MQKRYYVYCAKNEKKDCIKKLRNNFIFESSTMQDATDILCVGNVSRNERKKLILSGKPIYYVDKDLLPLSIEKDIQDYLEYNN